MTQAYDKVTIQLTAKRKTLIESSTQKFPLSLSQEGTQRPPSSGRRIEIYVFPMTKQFSPGQNLFPSLPLNLAHHYWVVGLCVRMDSAVFLAHTHSHERKKSHFLRQPRTAITRNRALKIIMLPLKYTHTHPPISVMATGCCQTVANKGQLSCSLKA